MRIGIIGTGAMAAQMAQAVQFVAGVSVSAVLSRKASRGARFCEAIAGEATACTEAERFFENSDAVYIATPAVTHGRFIEMAIEAGKPILCEKPLTVSSMETARLLSLLRAIQMFF